MFYVLFPLSVVFIRYFPEIGRNVSGVSGTHMLCGVADHKNTLGQLTMVFCLVLLWDLMETRKRDAASRAAPQPLARLLNLGIGVYLLLISQSATALVCFLLGTVLLFGGGRLSGMRHAKTVIMASVLFVACAALLNETLGFSEFALQLLGRDASLTGRTDIWRVILERNTNDLIGVAFAVSGKPPQVSLSGVSWEPTR